MNSLFLTDGYKTSHNKQYPEGTTLVFSNFTINPQRKPTYFSRWMNLVNNFV